MLEGNVNGCQVSSKLVLKMWKKKLTHIAWNIYVPNSEFDERVVENEFVQKVLTEKINSSREMRNPQELTLVYQNN